MKVNYAIENLRSIQKMEPVELRPITVLVGANSSGKSTFLRSISLLRQSIEDKIDQPILWYKKNSVDFGGFETAVSNRNQDKEIKFKFKIQDLSYPTFEIQNSSNNTIISEKFIQDIFYNISVNKNDNGVSINKIELIVNDYNLSLKFFTDQEKGTKFHLNENLLDNELHELFSHNLGEFFGGMYINVKKSEENSVKKLNDIFNNIEEFKFVNRIIYTEPIQIISYFINNKFMEYFPSNFTPEILHKEIIRLVSSYPLDSLEEIGSKSQQFNEVFNNILFNEKNYDIKNYVLNVLNVFFMYRVNRLLHVNLNDFFANSTRIGPARGQIDDRFYRHQELDVSEISVNSDNFPMFLLKLKTKGVLEDFSNWVNGLIGYRIGIKDDFPNVEINVIKNDFPVNLIDTGYGVSQILPILAQIWLNTIGSEIESLGNGKKYGLYPVLMEQPELHLHPFHQAQVADAIVSSLNFCRKSKRDSQQLFIVETHSEAIINRLGTLVRDDEISEEDVQILVFTKKEDSDSTEVRVSRFNDNGTLSNWPYGFFRYSNAY